MLKKKKELHTTHGVAIKSQCPSRRLHKFPIFSAPFNKRLGVIDPISTCPCYSNLLKIETNKVLIIHIFCLFTITDTYSMCIYWQISFKRKIESWDEKKRLLHWYAMRILSKAGKRKCRFDDRIYMYLKLTSSHVLPCASLGYTGAFGLRNDTSFDTATSFGCQK
jgi:hypothetical protein